MYSTAAAMFSAVNTAEPFTGRIMARVLPTGGRMVAAKESGWNTFLIHSQLCRFGRELVLFMSRIIWTVYSLPSVRMAENMIHRIGRLISMGRQPAVGLTCSLR